ncbi:MAG: DUF2974 domain-containing protein [Oligoflexia bacterium]|nr:DUF2974 domain-containing protein [Oligoflexia bacterium]
MFNLKQIVAYLVSISATLFLLGTPQVCMAGEECSIVIEMPDSTSCNSDHNNLTAAFTTTYDHFMNSDHRDHLGRLGARLQDYTIIMVGGFLSGMGKLGGERNFEEQAKFLKKLGLSEKEEDKNFQMSSVNTFQTIAYNIEKLRKDIQNAPKKVILIGHSMGGLEAVFALIGTSEELQKKVAGIITLQSPFKGSPIVDLVDHATTAKQRVARALAYGVLENPFKRIAGHAGSYNSFRDLRESARIDFLDDPVNAQALDEITKRIPVINLVGWKERGLGVHQRDQGLNRNNYCLSRPVGRTSGAFYTNTLKIAARLFHDANSPDGEMNRIRNTDLMVPKDSQKLGFNAKYVHQEGIDHLSMVMSSAYRPVDKVIATAALLELLLNEIQNRF